MNHGPISYLLGLEGGAFTRDTYGMFALQGHLGVLNGVSMGPLHFLSGVGGAYLDITQINLDSFSETRLAADGLWSLHWKNEAILHFAKAYALRGGFSPQWYLADVEALTPYWDGWSWHVGIHSGLVHMQYEERYFAEQRMRSFQVIFGYALFE